MEERLEKMSRREFLAGSTGFAAGAAVGAAVGGGLFNILPASAAENEAPAWPWPYKKLDPEKARKIGYELYFKGG